MKSETSAPHVAAAIQAAAQVLTSERGRGKVTPEAIAEYAQEILRAWDERTPPESTATMLPPGTDV